MRLKSFYAKTMKEAMQMVRDTLGEDAVIVATRDEQGGRAVRVTAAIDPNDYNDEPYQSPAFETHERERPSSADSWLQYDDENDETAVAEEITDTLLRHGVSEDVMDQILSCVTVIGFDQASAAMVAAIEHLYNFRPLPDKAHKKPLMFVGPPGAGKTLAVAKQATRCVMDGLKVSVISTDTVRAGGVEQLQGFTKLLGTDLHRANSPAHLAELISRFRPSHQTLIDTSGINPFDQQDVKALAQLIGTADIEPVLVLPAGMDAEESGEVARIFASIGAQSLLPTRIDVARRLGGVLAAAHHGGLLFSDASNTAKVADGLLSLNPKNLSKLLMPSAFRDSDEGFGSHSNTSGSQQGSSRKMGMFQ
ncbi:MAG: GTPase [Micavibrio sp.]|nr:GTPase [Micavibrio sp.]